jgi:IS30 family transposase
MRKSRFTGSQIASWLRDQYPERPEMWVSLDTIYRSLLVQARDALKKELIGHLRSSRSIRRPRHAVDGRAGERILGPVPKEIQNN